MALNDLEDALAATFAAAEELQIRKLIACAARAVERTRELVQGSRELIATERKLMAPWRERRPGVRARLARRGPRPVANRSSAPAPAPLPQLPKAA